MKPSSRHPFAALRTLLFIAFVFGTFAQAQTFTTLYSFTGRDGDEPQAGVVRDKAGNVYGTTWWGGRIGYHNYGSGVVFRVTTDGAETVLHSFCSYPKCADGAHPGAPLVPDNTGNIYYGTTAEGGSSTNCSYGCGVVFRIDTAGSESVLHSFAGGTSDGCAPFQGLVRDTAGNLYGTTIFCGTHNQGTIFKIDSAGIETILHNFDWDSHRGNGGSHLVLDKAGNLYGLAGGSNCNKDCGVLYELTAKGKFIILHHFAGGTSDGCDPQGSVLQDKAGNLYGTTLGCGSSNYGTIWKVSNRGTETILHNFAGGTSDGCYPWAGVARDSKANLFGVTYGCGAGSDGTLYELSAKGRLILLHSFAGTDGANPVGEVLRTAKGVMYGTALLGANQCSSYGCGTVWKYIP